MKKVKGVVIILTIYLIGVAISKLIGGIISSNVIGMLILFLLLQCGVVKEEDIKSICNLILDNIILFFIPIIVGIMSSYKLLTGQLAAVVSAIIISTIITIAIIGVIQQYLGRRWRR